MGFFSKMTCDTNQSVANIHSGHTNSFKPVYLLQPDGQPPLKQDMYEGYGVVGMSWIEWLSTVNYGVVDRQLGIMLDCGHYYTDEQNTVYACQFAINEESLRTIVGDEVNVVIFPDFAVPIDELQGLSMNEAITKGSVKECRPEVKYPVKLSYDPLAKYEDYDASENCPFQGYFYGEL